LNVGFFPEAAVAGAVGGFTGSLAGGAFVVVPCTVGFVLATDTAGTAGFAGSG
jgi:hypothetical protein